MPPYFQTVWGNGCSNHWSLDVYRIWVFFFLEGVYALSSSGEDSGIKGRIQPRACFGRK